MPVDGDPRPPFVIPDHELIRCIGRGSYGEVWLARNMMGVHRAVKIVYRKSFKDDRPFERELSGIRKFEPISRSHEGFVDVLHVGINEGQGCFYYVMELGDDQTSGQQVDPDSYLPKTLGKQISLQGKLTLQECLELGLALSQALAELHRRDLVHRDVKPSNIIFVNGVPKLADIGLVADVNEARSYVGTEGFIPPEGPGTPQADVYSLGKVLYEACTGKDRQDFPELPTQLDKLPDHVGFLELNEVILGACKNDPAKRYQSAWDMHADLVVLANGKSVKRLKMLERRLSNVKRIGGISALVLVILAGFSYQTYQSWKNSLELHQRKVGESVANGNNSMDSGDLLGALPFFADALKLDGGNPRLERMHRLRAGSILAQSPKLVRMWFLGAGLRDAEFSPDGKRILISEYISGNFRIFDFQSGELSLSPFGQKLQAPFASFSPDGQFLVTAHENSAFIVDATTLKVTFALPHNARVTSAKFSPDGLWVVTGCNDGIARIWNAQSGRLQTPLGKHGGAIQFAAFSHDGRLVVTASKDNTAQIWDVKTGAKIGKPLPHGSWVNYAAFSPDDRKLITGSFDRKARVWDVETSGRILPDLNHGDGVQSAEFSPDGRLIITASLDGTVRLWRADNLQPLLSNPILKHNAPVSHASFSPDGELIVTTCTDGKVRVWDLAGAAVPPVFIRSWFGDDARGFLATTTNTETQIWDAAPGRTNFPSIAVGRVLEKAELTENVKFIEGVSTSPTNSKGAGRILRTWDAVTGRPIVSDLALTNFVLGASLIGGGNRVMFYGDKAMEAWEIISANGDVRWAWSFSPDGRKIMTKSGSEVRVWESSTGRPAFEPLQHNQEASYASFSSDGRYLVTCCSNGQLDKCYAQVWDALTGRPVGPKLWHGDGVLFAAFSPDNRRIVTCGEDRKAIIWDIPTGRQLILPACKHDDQVWGATFSPDGRWIVTACADGTARVWNSETGDPLTPWLRCHVRLEAAKFLPDGRRVVTMDDRGRARIWELHEDDRPVEDLRDLSRLLIGDTLAPENGPSQPETDPLRIVWERLRARYLGDFSVSSREVAAWREFQAAESEYERNWYAAAFHLKLLLTNAPGDPSLLQRLARANENLKKHD
ncbi:MAG: hypothetical protein JWR26_3442 [Pedosphaera sp.]|nr:hypothetical protein [Pedosphaera sp.]